MAITPPGNVGAGSGDAPDRWARSDPHSRPAEDSGSETSEGVATPSPPSDHVPTSFPHPAPGRPPKPLPMVTHPSHRPIPYRANAMPYATHTGNGYPPTQPGCQQSPERRGSGTLRAWMSLRSLTAGPVMVPFWPRRFAAGVRSGSDGFTTSAISRPASSLLS